MTTEANTVLSDEAIAKIEARALEVKELVGVDQFGEDMLALCTTVKALRVEAKAQKTELLQLSGRGDLLAKVHVSFDDLDPVAAVRNEFDRLRNIVVRELQFSLSAVERERDELRAQLVEHDRVAGLVAEALSNEVNRRID